MSRQMRKVRLVASPVLAVLAAALGLAACSGPRPQPTPPTDQASPSSAAVTACRADPRLASMAWLAGTWAQHRKNLTLETWSPPCAGTMLGHGQLVDGDTTVFFEHLRIGLDAGTVTLFATPAGHPTTAFRRTQQGPTHAVFSNPEHGSPHTLTYTREGDVLRVRVESRDQGQDRVDELVLQRVPVR